MNTKKTGTKHVTGKEGGCDSTQFIKMTVTMDVALFRDQKIRVVPSKEIKFLSWLKIL